MLRSHVADSQSQILQHQEALIARRAGSLFGEVRQWVAARLFLGAVMLVVASPLGAQTGSPVFSTQAPESGIVGSAFDVLLPLVNTGTASADTVTVTSVLLGKTSQQNLALPLLLGSLDPNTSDQVVLQFDVTGLVVGANYLLSLRGTYQSGTATLGFAVNRFVRITASSPSVENDLTRWITLDALRAVVTSLPHVDAVADAQTILAFLQSRPEFVDSGMYPDSTSLWARFADGPPIVIGNDDLQPVDESFSVAAARTVAPRVARAGRGAGSGGVARFQTVAARTRKPESLAALPMPPRAAPAPAAANLPASSSFRLLNALTRLPAAASDPKLTGDLGSWLRLENYQPSGGDASVAGLKQVGGDGIFFFRTHGGFFESGSNTDQLVYALWTSDPSTSASEKAAANAGDFLEVNSPLVSFLAEQQDKVFQYHLAITAQFVEKYWGAFAQDSLVYIDACDSDRPDAFKQEMSDEDASVYAGWTQPTGDPLSARTARFVFDRLLGANQICPETNPGGKQDCTNGPATPPIFAQRPFDYASIANSEFAFHNVGTWKGGATHAGLQLNFTKLGGNFSLLAPSISNMTVDETQGQGGQLTIVGIFGQDPRQNSSGSVTVGGQEATIESWDPDKIVVDLNLSGGGSAGDVVVTVRDHKSNVARLTEWKGKQFDYAITGNGSLFLDTVFNLHFRADIRKYRPVIHNEPIEPTGGTVGASDSTGTYFASGSGAGAGETYKWSGAGSLVGFTLQIPPTGVNFFVTTVQITDSKNLRVSVGAASEANAGATCTEVTSTPPPNVSLLPIEGPGNLVVFIGDAGPRSFLFELDDDAVIKQNSFGASGKAPFLSYLCMDDAQTASYKFSWGPQAPTDGTAPNPNSAR